MPKVPKITSLKYLSDISRKAWRMKLIFYLQLNTESFFKLILSFYVRVARHTCITQNNKFAFSLQYIKKEVSDQIDFPHVDKHESSLQIYIDIWWGWSNIPKVLKISSLQCLYNVSKNKLEMKLFFCMRVNVKVSYKSISTLWVSMFSTSWYYFYFWWRSSILKVLKLTSLQYFYNTSKKEGVYFLHIDKHQSFYKPARFLRKWSDTSGVPKIEI